MNVKDLHDHTAEILHKVNDGDAVFVTRYGEPIAVIRSSAEEDLEGLIMLSDQRLHKGLEEARANVAAGRVTELDELIAEAQAEL